MAQQLMNPTSIHKDVAQFLALLSGLRIQHCHELWCRSQMRVRFYAAVALAQAGSYSSDWTPGLGTPICHGCGPKKTKRQKKNALQFQLGEFGIFWGPKPPVSLHGPSINLYLLQTQTLRFVLASLCVKHTDLCSVMRARSHSKSGWEPNGLISKAHRWAHQWDKIHTDSFIHALLRAGNLFLQTGQPGLSPSSIPLNSPSDKSLFRPTCQYPYLSYDSALEAI